MLYLITNRFPFHRTRPAQTTGGFEFEWVCDCSHFFAEARLGEYGASSSMYSCGSRSPVNLDNSFGRGDGLSLIRQAPTCDYAEKLCKESRLDGCQVSSEPFIHCRASYRPRYPIAHTGLRHNCTPVLIECRRYRAARQDRHDGDPQALVREVLARTNSASNGLWAAWEQTQMPRTSARTHTPRRNAVPLSRVAPGETAPGRIPWVLNMFSHRGTLRYNAIGQSEMVVSGDKWKSHRMFANTVDPLGMNIPS
jgi:hypothetical protein